MNKKNMVRFTLDMNPPTTTFQAKRWRCVFDRIKRKWFPRSYKDDKLLVIEEEYMTLLKRHRPKHPLKPPIWEEIKFTFQTNDKRKWGKRKFTKPDNDNGVKIPNDCMERLGFYKNDSQISDQYISKRWGEKGSIEVVMFEIVEG